MRDGGTPIPHRATICTEFPLAEILARALELADLVVAASERHPEDEKLASDSITLRAHVVTLRDDLALTEAGLG